MQAILYSEINLCGILIVGFILYKSQRLFTESDARQIFSWLLLANIFLFMSDICWVQVNQRPGSMFYELNWLFNSSYFIFSAVVPYLWFLFSETRQDCHWVENNWNRCLAAIPLAVVVILSLSSYTTGWMFQIDGSNGYSRGPLYGIHILVDYGYVGITALRCLVKALRTDSYMQREKYLSLLFFVVPALFFATLQEFFSGCPFMCLGNTVGIFSVFVNSLEQKISLDPLTQLNNRLQLERYLEQRIPHYQKDTDRQLYLVLIDIDDFKKINDTYGHLEGDRALRRLADAMRQTNPSGFAAHYGGDEFVLILESEEQRDIEQWCCDIRRILQATRERNSYDLELSSGIICYTPEFSSIAAFIGAADVAMYDMKLQQV